jgi:nucleoside-diphosphate-sugar epimerase
MMPPAKGTPDETIKAIKDATLNVLRQARDSGVRKVVLTSSWAATINPVGDVTKAFTDVTFTGSGTCNELEITFTLLTLS